MRALLILLGIGALATAALAVNELETLKKTVEPARVAEVAAPEVAPQAPVEHAAPASQLSTWKGALPFGGVAGESDDQDSHDVIVDEEDRCPADNNNDDDGCPDVLVEPPHKVVVTVDGEPRELEVSSRIRIIKLEQIIY